MPRIPFLILSFLDFVVFVVTTPIRLKSEEMCNFFNKRGYPASVVQAGHHRAQQIDWQSALLTVTKREQRENSIHSHISPSQPRNEINHSKKL